MEEYLANFQHGIFLITKVRLGILCFPLVQSSCASTFSVSVFSSAVLFL